MYLTYYHLRRKPFQINTDPRFLWLGEKHKEALATLKYGIQDNKGFLLLTGDVGTGKTTLINALLNSLEDKVVVASVSDPALSRLEFFQYVAFSFGIKQQIRSKVEFLLAFSQFLQEQADRDQKVLLIIDEAQRLSHDLLEEIRLLSNIERQKAKLLNIFFIGQNEFDDLLAEPRNRALRQRITVNYRISTLSEEEVAGYIRHRLIIAGSRRTLFDPDAVRQVYLFSGGYPRLINIICDRALLTCYVEDSKQVKAKTVKECAKELELPGHSFPVIPKNQVRADSNSPAPLPADDNGKKSRRWLYAGLATPVIAGLAVAVLHPPDDLMFREVREVLTGFGMEIQDRTGWPAKIAREGTALSAMAEAVQMPPAPGEAKMPARKGEPGGLVLEATPKKKTIAIIEEPLPEEPLITANQAAPDFGPEPVAGAERQPPFSFLINFEINSDRASEGSYQELERLAALMRENSDLQAIAIGYTDTSGFYQYNLAISTSRADMVKTFLVSQGIEPHRIQAMGRGQEHPLASNETEDGRRLNRRVEIELVRGG